MSASFLTNYFYDLPEDLQQMIIWYNAASIIIFRNIVGWTIRKQAFKNWNILAESLLGCPIGYTSVAFWGVMMTIAENLNLEAQIQPGRASRSNRMGVLWSRVLQRPSFPLWLLDLCGGSDGQRQSGVGGRMGR